MKLYTSSLFLILFLAFSFMGCDAQNPVCSDNFCVVGEVFLRSELEENQEFSEANVDDSQILAVLAGTPEPTTEPTTEPETQLQSEPVDLATADVGEFNFKSVTVTGLLDWDFLSEEWQYRENRITYLKKVTLEFESDTGKFGENRVILVHLNKDTVRRDANFVEHVPFLDTASIQLTHHIGIAEFKGDIVGAPTK